MIKNHRCRYNIRTIITIFVLLLLLMSNFVVFQPSSLGSSKHTFSDQSTEKIITFPIDGGIDDSTNLSIEYGTVIFQASLNITSIPDNGKYPSNVNLDVGRDGDYEWSFSGEGYGEMGNQTLFNNSASFLKYRFSGSTGESLKNNIQIPKSANLISAQLNISGSFTEFVESTRISSTIGMGYNCEVGDIDGDNDLDAIIAYRSEVSPFPTELAWYENTIGDGSSWTAHNIANTGITYPYGLAIGDLDGDDDLDVVISDNTWNSRDILWYNNTNGLGTSWTVHTVQGSIPGTSVWIYNLALADMNNDSYIDIVGTLSNNDNNQEDVYWYSNINGDGRTWTLNIINETIIGARGIYIGDIDGDGDNDTAVTAIPTSGTDQIFWFSNDNGVGTSWTRYLINDTLSDPFAVAIADLDNDTNPDLAVIGGTNTVWFEAPDDPTIVSNWTLHTIGTGGSWGGDIAVADIGYNNINKKPDNNLDIIIAGRTNNQVLVYQNDGTPLDGGWKTINLNTNHAYANWLTIGDINGDNYIDTLVASSLTSTIDDLIWYKLLGGYPSEVELNLGSDTQPDWVEPDLLNYSLQILDFKDNLTQYLANDIGYKDEYGTTFVSVPIEITSNSSGLVVVDKLSIIYDFTATVDIKPNGNLGQELTEALKDTPPGKDGNCTIPLRFSSGSAGKIKIDNLKIEYNQAPWFKTQLPTKLVIFEDSVENSILILSDFMADDYLEADQLNYEISYLSGPGTGKINMNISNNNHLNADVKSGSDNDNWTGYMDFKFKVTDNYGSTIDSNLIRIEIIPVNDEPILGPNEYTNIILAEGQSSKPIDLDNKNYFLDAESDPLYFSIDIDPDNEIESENITFNIEPATNQLILKPQGDWFGTDLPIRIYCDDSTHMNKTLFKDFNLTVLNINDPPVWKEIPDQIIDEDEIKLNVLNLTEYVTDQDNKRELVEFAIVSNSNSKSIGVSINNEKNLDIFPLVSEFSGSATINVRATDPGQNYSDESFDIVYESVNDPPEVNIESPMNNSLVKSDRLLLTWSCFDIDNSDYEITYSIFFGESSPNQELVSNITENQYIISGLADDGTYYFRVIADDGDSSGFSQIIIIGINLDNQPEVGLISPKPDAIFPNNDFDFSWEVIESGDQELLFDLYLSTDPNPLNFPPFAKNLIYTTYRIEDLEVDKTYYWTVIPKFSYGFGTCSDGISKFALDTSKIAFGLNLNPSTNEIQVNKGDKNTFWVDVKNLGSNNEELILLIQPVSISNNIDLDIRSRNWKINLDPEETKRVTFTLDSTNIIEGEYQISLTASSTLTPANTRINMTLKILEPKDDSKNKGMEFNITEWWLLIIIIIIGLIGAIFIIRYKPKTEETYDEELIRTTEGEHTLPGTDILYQPSLDGVTPAYQPQAQGASTVPSMGPGPTGSGLDLPQLPPTTTTGGVDLSLTESTPTISTSTVPTSEPEPPSSEAEQDQEPISELEEDISDIHVLLPEDIEMVQKSAEIDSLDMESEPPLDSISVPEIALPDPMGTISSNISRSDEELNDKPMAPSFGEPLQLETIDSMDQEPSDDTSSSREDLGKDPDLAIDHDNDTEISSIKKPKKKP